MKRMPPEDYIGGHPFLTIGIFYGAVYAVIIDKTYQFHFMVSENRKGQF